MLPKRAFASASQQHPSHEPMLVRESHPRVRKQNAPYYYLIPFGLKREYGNGYRRLARHAVLVNAFTGDFEEITTFGRPKRYSSRDEAVRAAADFRTEDPKKLTRELAELVFTPGPLSYTRSNPHWSIGDELTTYVPQSILTPVNHPPPTVLGD